MAELEPITPTKAKELYLAQREDEVSDETVQAHHYRLKHLIRWCEKKGITNINDLSPLSLHEYRQWRKKDGDLNAVTLQTQLSTLKVFIRFCESINAAEQGLHEKIMLPSVDEEENTRDRLLEGDAAKNILSYLRRYEYASLRHTVCITLWNTACRIGALQSLDVDDFVEESQSLRFRHRPDSGTRLKNGKGGERICALSDDVVAVLSDFIDVNRPNVTDNHQRKPLFATEHGRMHKSNIRSIIYAITRPCVYNQDCPHGRDLDECEATNHDAASKCPSSRSPHDIRRGSITEYLREEVPKTVVSDRANVAPDILDKHYNRMTEEERMEQRREYFD